MEKTKVIYRYEKAEDFASFLEYVIDHGYELDMFAEGYESDIFPEGKFDRDQFISNYQSVRRVCILHKTEVERDSWGNTLKSWAARSGHFPGELELWDVGGELERLIQDYISEIGNSL